MNELELTKQMEITGGGVFTWGACIIIGTTIYKVLCLRSGRILIPKLIRIK